MIIFRRIAICFICCMILITPLLQCGVVYADTNWENIRQQSDLADGFRYYCESRDLTIEGSSLNALTTFTTQTFNNLCNGLGIDITQLQAEIKAEYDNSGKPIRFLYNSSGIAAYNRIFAQFLQDNNLSVGDSANENTNNLYSGKMYTDADGFTALLWDLPVTDNNSQGVRPNKYGTTYKYDGYDIKSLYSDGSRTITFNGYKNNNDYSITRNVYYFSRKHESTWGIDIDNVYQLNNSNQNTLNYFYYSEMENKVFPCQCILFTLNGSSSNIYVGMYQDYRNFTIYPKESWVYFDTFNGSAHIQDNINIYLTTNNTVINNNTYEGDTIINQDGTPDTTDTPDPDPDYDPYPDGGGTITSPSNGNGGGGTDGTITFPDLDLNLPEINWSLGDLSNKFPFSIPFDLVSLVRVLDAPAEAPRFQGTMNLGITTYDYDINLESFSTVAAACRTAEVIAFIFGLIIITRNLIRG